MTKFGSITRYMAIAAIMAAVAATPAAAWVLYVGGGKSIGAFKVEKQESFKGLNQVVIGQFTVAFFTKKVDYDGGGFLAAGRDSKATGYLTGVSSEQFQKLTDAAYTDFLQQLSKNGISVVDGAGLTADKYYAKVKLEESGTRINVPLKKDDKADALAFWPTQLGRNNNALLQMRMMDFNMGNTYTAEYNYARTSKIPVLNVVYLVDFAKPTKSTGGGLFQEIAVKAGLAISPFGTQIGLMDANGKFAKMNLNVAIEESGDFAEIHETTSQLTKTVHAASVLGGAFGLTGKLGSGPLDGKMTAKFDYVVKDPAVYSEKAQHAAAQMNDLLARQMAELK